MFRKRLPSAIAICLLATATSAQDIKVENCNGLSIDKKSDFPVAFACVGLLKDETERLSSTLASAIARIEALEKNIVPAIGDHRNTRAVVAYYSDKSEKTCPEGWSPYEDAKDRFVLGAGGKYPVVGQTGGEAEVTLSEAQMPQHIHSATKMRTAAKADTMHQTAERVHVTVNARVPGALFSSAGGPRNFGSHDHAIVGNTDPAGGDKPQNNMPPYIALYFCQKD